MDKMCDTLFRGTTYISSTRACTRISLESKKKLEFLASFNQNDYILLSAVYWRAVKLLENTILKLSISLMMPDLEKNLDQQFSNSIDGNSTQLGAERRKEQKINSVLL